MAGLVAPAGDLAGAQPGAGIGHRVVGVEPLLGSILQVHAPGVGVALLDALQEVLEVPHIARAREQDMEEIAGPD